jgi:hypothetical protein
VGFLEPGTTSSEEDKKQPLSFEEVEENPEDCEKATKDAKSIDDSTGSIQICVTAAYLRLQSILIGTGKHTAYTLCIQSMDGQRNACGTEESSQLKTDHANQKSMTMSPLL